MMKYLISIWWLCILQISVLARSPDHIYRIKEELPLHHVVGFLNIDIAKFRTDFRSNSVSYKLMNILELGVSCFDVDPKSSKLSIVRKIDRELLCKGFVKECQIVLKVAIKGTDTFVTILVEIEDVNDNAPQWQMNKLTIQFNEGEEAGSRKSILSATDADSGDNGQIKYTLETATDAFILVQEHGLYLQTLKLLDREQVSHYTLSILAEDRGIVIKSSRLELIVEILDINDNEPKFSTSVFRPTKVIPETIPIGSVILKLTATDADSSRNGEFSFSFSNVEDRITRSYFSVRPNGQIEVQRKLDFESGLNKFEFKVVVKDHAISGYEKSSESRVEITISDENDESPVITIYNILENPDINHSFIKENQPARTAIAHVYATDKDFKGTDSVTCTIKDYNGTNNKLTLESTNDNNEFKLTTLKSFDHEKESSIFIGIQCVDSANHKTTKNLTIYIGDLNDNVPEFLEKTFHLKIKENQDPGTMLAKRVQARDADFGENSIIHYEILTVENVPFTIDSSTGTIRSKIKLDREHQSKYQFIVSATDSGKPALSSTATVIVNVEDVNDSPVVIEHYPSEFRIMENSKRNSYVGQIIAKDNDNQSLIYFLHHNAEKFSINRSNGIITTKKSLDREEKSQYQFLVFVTDRRYTATSQITIFVDDYNDNAPVFTMPNITHNSITIQASEAVGNTLTKIKAVDKDSKENAQIQYSIKHSSQRVSFSIDKESGMLYLDSSLYSRDLSHVDHFLLDLEACDYGKPQLCTSFKKFKIYIDKSSDKLYKSSDRKNGITQNIDISGISENIIVALIVFLLLMILATVFVILLLRKRSRNSSNHHKSRKDHNNSGPQNLNRCFSPNMKTPFETDQCSAEVCEITSRLSPSDQENKNLMANAQYYHHLTEQYHIGTGYVQPFGSDHHPMTYQIPPPYTTSTMCSPFLPPQQFYPTSQSISLHQSIPLIPDHKLAQKNPNEYYSKYDDSADKVIQQPQTQMQTQMQTQEEPEMFNPIIESVKQIPLNSPNLKMKKTQITPRKPQASFV